MMRRRSLTILLSAMILAGVIGASWWIVTRSAPSSAPDAEGLRNAPVIEGALTRQNVVAPGTEAGTPIPEEPVYTVDELRNIEILPGGSLGDTGDTTSTSLAEYLGVSGESPPPTETSPNLVIPSAPAASTAPQTAGGSDDDGDGLTNDQERQLGTDINNPDTDGDGLTDGEEALRYSTDPKKFDTDGDGLTDGEEVKQWHTNPLIADTDGDGFSDGEEVRNGYNPNGPGTF